MVTIRKCQRYACTATVFVAMGAAVAFTAAPAFAAGTIQIAGAAADEVGVRYTCDAAAGVASIQVMAGDPNANSAAATGAQNNPTCDGAEHTGTVSLSAVAGQPQLAKGQSVQVRAALVDQSETVISGTAAVITLD